MLSTPKFKEMELASGYSARTAPIKRPSKLVTSIVIAVSLIVLLAPIIVGYYTDWLWFGEVDFRRVFTTVLLTRIALFVVFGLVAGAATWFSGYLAFRLRPDSLHGMDPRNPIHAYRRMLERSLRKVLLVLPIVVGVFAGLVGQGAWRPVVLFIHGQPFGKTDPQFGMDFGFYAFDLPFINLVVESLSVIVAVSFIVGLLGHYLLGGIRAGNPATGQKSSFSRGARYQLVITAGVWMLLQVLNYWLDRYTLLYSGHQTFTGGSYTDIKAVLPAKIILMVIALVVAAAFFATVFLKDLRIPALATGLMVLSAVVIGTAWPMIVEQFSVAPNRAEKEAEYIGRNIDATRYAYGIGNDKVTYLENWGAEGAPDEKVAADGATLSNIRLLDPEILSPTFTQQQQLKNFYGFPDTLSIDRYKVGGQLRDFVVAARELDPNALQENQKDWINRHTVYTHGNGFIAAQANQVDEVARDVGSTRGGYPVYTVSDLQTNAASADGDAKKLGIKVDEPRVYYGPVIAGARDGADYAIVGNTGNGPMEYDTDANKFTYNGEGGVKVGNPLNRAAFAMKYREMNLILSDRVGKDSKILFDRDPRQRVKKVAPWLTMDSATYPAVIDGRIKWIVDGYTTLDNLPYSERTSLTESTEDSQNPEGATQRLLSEQVGYIRNSVKATVDAYDGSVDLYEFDQHDPVLKAWEGVFPGTVKPREQISDELLRHLRYPEDLFKVQRTLLARYHVDDPRVFFNNDAFWSVPGDPTLENKQRDLAQPPYQVVAADPETHKPAFQLITPFRGLKRDFLAAHMTVASDPERYGKITVRVLPTNTQTQGPRQAQDTMMSSDQIARDRTLWEGTNDLHNGNLLTLPVGGGEILYAEPVYSQRKNQDSAFPKLLRVLVSYKGKVGYAPTIAEALQQVGIDPREATEIAEVGGGHKGAVNQDTPKKEPGDSQKAPTPPASGSGAAGAALGKVNEALRNLDAAKGGNFEQYGKALDQLDKAIAEYKQSQGGQGGQSGAGGQ